MTTKKKITTFIDNNIFGDVFILEAIRHYSEEILQDKDFGSNWKTTFISPEFWKNIAENASHTLSPTQNEKPTPLA